MLESKRTTSIEERQEQMKLEQAVLRACNFLEKRIVRLEARLAAVELKDGPVQFKTAPKEEEETTLLQSCGAQHDLARYSIFAVSEHGVKFKLQGDGLDKWRRRFLGSQREKAIHARLTNGGLSNGCGLHRVGC